MNPVQKSDKVGLNVRQTCRKSQTNRKSYKCRSTGSESSVQNYALSLRTIALTLPVATTSALPVWLQPFQSQSQQPLMRVSSRDQSGMFSSDCHGRQIRTVSYASIAVTFSIRTSDLSFPNYPFILPCAEVVRV